MCRFGKGGGAVGIFANKHRLLKYEDHFDRPTATELAPCGRLLCRRGGTLCGCLLRMAEVRTGVAWHRSCSGKCFSPPCTLPLHPNPPLTSEMHARITRPVLLSWNMQPSHLARSTYVVSHLPHGRDSGRGEHPGDEDAELNVQRGDGTSRGQRLPEEAKRGQSRLAVLSRTRPWSSGRLGPARRTPSRGRFPLGEASIRMPTAELRRSPPCLGSLVLGWAVHQ